MRVHPGLGEPVVGIVGVGDGAREGDEGSGVGDVFVGEVGVDGLLVADGVEPGGGDDHCLGVPADLA